MIQFCPRHVPTNSNSSERTLMDDLPSLPHDGGRGAPDQDNEDAGPLSLSDIQLIDEVQSWIGRYVIVNGIKIRGSH